MTDKPARLLATALVAAPLLGLGSELIVPRNTTETPAEELAMIASHSGAFLAADLMYLASTVLFAIGVVGVVARVRQRGRVLTRVAGTMVFLGSVALACHAVLLLAVRDLALHADRAAMAAANDVISNGVGAMVVLVLHLFAFDLGLTLLTIGAWRARLIPVWAAPFGFLCLVGDFSPGTYNGILLNLAATVAFVMLASGVQRRQPVATPAEPVLAAA